MMPDWLQYLDGFAGLAALVNSLLLWPVVKTLKEVVIKDHGPRIVRLESSSPKKKVSRARTRTRPRRR
jgi:hypothetical protein